MPAKLVGHYYKKNRLLVVSGGMFTLTVRRVHQGNRSYVLQRFGLRTRGGWKDNGNGIALAVISTRKHAG